MWERRWCMLLSLVALLALCAVAPVGAQGTTYTDPQGRYSFTVPAGWQPTTPPQTGNLPPGTAISGVFNAAPPLNGNINIVTVALPSSVPLDQVATQSRDNVAKSVPGYQEIAGGIQSTTLGGQPARRYDYALTPPNSPKLHGAQVLAVQGNTVFVLTFTAADADFATFFQQGSGILSSFKYLGTGGATVAPTTLPSTGVPHVTPWYGQSELAVLLAGSALVLGGLVLRRRYRVA